MVNRPRLNWQLPSWLRAWVADSAALLFSQAGVVVATSVLAILLARHLGPEDWGVFSGFLGLSLALSVFIEFGLTQWLLRELAHLWAADTKADDVRLPAGQIVTASLAVSTTLGMLMVIGAVIATAIFGMGASSSVLLVALVTYGALIASCSGLEAVFRARRRVRRVVGATALEKALLLVLVVASIAFGFPLIAIGIAYLVAGIARVAFDTTSLLRGAEVEFVRPSFGAVRGVMHESFPFALNRASLNIIPRLDVLILAALSPLAAGYFALGDRALGPVLIIPVVMSSALYPFLAREATGSRAGVRIAVTLGALGCLVGVIGIALAPRLVPVVFGADYHDAVPVVQIMLVAIPLVFAANPLLAHVYTARLERRRLGAGLAGVACIGTGAIVLGQTLVGPEGAAAGYVTRSILIVGVLVIAVKLADRDVATMAPGGVAQVSGKTQQEPSVPSTSGA
jgi:O-antigen/teichoic acid export membrane protein